MNREANMDAKTPDRIEKQVLLRAPRAKVWRALSDSAEFGLWFGMKIAGPFVAGKTVRGTIVPTTVNEEVAKMQKPHEGTTIELQIVAIEPERLFSMRWHPYAIERDVDYAMEPTTLIVFELHDAEGGVLLTVTESGFDQIPLERRAKAFKANDGGWAKQMELINAYVTGNYGAGAAGSGSKATGAK
ncbi:MAG: SRPBCC family protein [Candidatus Acidiferrales bacterium]